MRERHFADVHELLDCLATVPEENFSRRKSRYSCPYDWDETLEALRSGWPEGLRDILDLSRQIDARLGEEEKSWTIQYDVSGEFIDMGRYVVGEPECCGTVIRDTILRPVVNVTVNIACLGRVWPETIKNRGAAVLSLVRLLRRDHIVNVHIYSKSNNVWESEAAYISFGMTTSNEFSDDLLGCYLGNVCVFRRCVFAVRELLFGNSNLGDYGDTDQHFKPAETPGETYIHIPGLGNNDTYGSLDDSVLAVVNALDMVRKKEAI